jgi:hypothetical protein
MQTHKNHRNWLKQERKENICDLRNVVMLAK